MMSKKKKKKKKVTVGLSIIELGYASDVARGVAEGMAIEET